MVQAVLPDVRVGVLGDWKRCRTLICVFDDIEARVVDRGEIEFGVNVAHPRRRRRDRTFKYLLESSAFSQAQYFGSTWADVLRIEFEYGYLGKLRRIADLAVRDHRWASPPRNHVRSDVPDNGIGSLARRDQ